MEVGKHCVSCNEHISVDKGMATVGSGQKGIWAGRDFQRSMNCI
jgi:hypothetical protein